MTARMLVAALATLGFVGACGERAADPSDRSVAPERIGETASAPAGLGNAAAGRASRYSKLTEANCKLVEAIEETGDWTRRCPGQDGLTVEWNSSDLREDLVLISAGTDVPLKLSNLVAKGAFDRLGETLEWRGPAGKPADVLVARVHVANAEGRDDSGRLTLIRLGPKPCVSAIVPPGPNQSERARAIADRPLPPCLNG